MSNDPLAEIKARWSSDELHRAEYWADLASRDVPALIKQVEEWRQAAVAEANLADERGTKLERANLAFDDQLKEIGKLGREIERLRRFEAMFTDCARHRDQAEQRARRHMEIVRQVAELVAPDEEVETG